MLCELYLNKNDFFRNRKEIIQNNRRKGKENEEQVGQIEKDSKMRDLKKDSLNHIHNHIKHNTQNTLLKADIVKTVEQSQNLTISAYMKYNLNIKT